MSHSGRTRDDSTRPPVFGVCTLRAEAQPEHLLITITTCRALEASAQRTYISRPRTVASMREALSIAEQFLSSFATWRDSPPSHRTPRPPASPDSDDCPPDDDDETGNGRHHHP